MKRLPDRAWLVFGLLGGLLLLYLVLPVAYLLSKASWREATSWLENPGALRAIRLSLLTSGIATAIMAFFGIPLGYFLGKSRWHGKHLLTALVLLPMVFPPVVGGILLLLLYGPYGPIGGLFEQHGLAFVNNAAGSWPRPFWSSLRSLPLPASTSNSSRRQPPSAIPAGGSFAVSPFPWRGPALRPA
jgi:ABC-type sulfate transport system permease component